MPADIHDNHSEALGGAELRNWAYPEYANLAAIPASAEVPTTIVSIAGVLHYWDGAEWIPWIGSVQQYAFLFTTTGAANPEISEDFGNGSLMIGETVAWGEYRNFTRMGAGVGVVVSAGSGTADGGQYIDIAGHQIEQIFSGSVDIAQYGARPGIDSTAAIQAAWTRAGALGLSCSAPAGTFTVSSSISSPLNSAPLIGAGAGVTVFQHDAAATHDNIIIVATNRDSDVRHLTLDGNNAATGTGSGIFAIGGGSHNWDSVEAINNPSYGFRAQLGGGTSIDAHVHNCKASSNGSSGLSLFNLAEGSVRGGDYNGNGIYGVVMSRCSDLEVTSLTANNNSSHGIVIVYSEQFSISTCTASNNGQSGIALGGGLATETPNRYWTLSGCVASNNTSHGISVDPTIVSGTAETQVGTVTGNTSRGNGIHGIYVQHSTDVAITGNVSADNAQEGILVALVDNFSVVGNVTSRNGTNGITLAKPIDPGFAGMNGVLASNTYDANTVLPFQVSEHYSSVLILDNPTGATADRPPAANLVTGQSFLNTGLGQPEWWNGTAWVTWAGTASTAVSAGEAGDGVQTDFVFATPITSSTPDVKVFVNDGTNTQLTTDGVSVLIDDAGDQVTAQFTTPPAAIDTVTIRVDA